MTADECKAACEYIGITKLGRRKNGKECYIAGNGKCRQEPRRGSKTLLVCKRGNIASLWIIISAIKI